MKRHNTKNPDLEIGFLQSHDIASEEISLPKENRVIINTIKKGNADNRKSRNLFFGLLVLISLSILTYSVMIFAKDITHSQPLDGFQIFLNNKDICTFSIGENVIWAGGADGLFKLTQKSETSNDKIKENGLNDGSEIGNTENDGSKDGSSKDDGSEIGNTENSKTENGNLKEGSIEYSVQKVGNYRYVKATILQGDKLWVGHDNGLTMIQGGIVKDYTDKNGLPDNRVNAICLDSKGDLWIGTWGGVVVINNDIIVRTIKKEDGLIDDMVNVIIEDTHNCMWFGSYVAPRGGISILDNDRWQQFSTQNALLHSNINAIIVTNNKDVIVGGGLYTQGGGTRFSYQDGKWTDVSTLEKKDGLAGSKIRSLLEDSKGRLWVGSEYEGLSVIYAGTSTIMTKKNGLSNDEVKTIKEETDGTIWIGTRKGLVRINKGGIENVK